MKYISVFTKLENEDKIRKLAHRMGWPYDLALGRVVHLWCHLGREDTPSGYLRDFAEPFNMAYHLQTTEDDAAKFIRALAEVELIEGAGDTLRVRGWYERQKAGIEASHGRSGKAREIKAMYEGGDLGEQVLDGVKPAGEQVNAASASAASAFVDRVAATCQPEVDCIGLDRIGLDRNGEEGKEKKKTKRAAVAADKPRDLGECRDYFVTIGSTAYEAEKFYDHWTSTGWRRRGGLLIRDWKATARTWTKNAKEFSATKRWNGNPQVDTKRKAELDAQVMETARKMRAAGRLRTQASNTLPSQS